MFQLPKPEARHLVILLWGVLLFVLLVVVIVNAIPEESETRLSKMRRAIKEDPGFEDVIVDYPRKLGLSVGGKVPSNESLARLRSIVERHVDDPGQVYWDVSVDERNSP
jgi:hypothetical protein